ncbi:hypothetical protein [Kribbella albertanoniae]|uniref:Uncharacterized protein n=1 Tax=Kribbella albertanoniae TaxID=1266829 RepID=A0A4V2XNA3_9ACTN|nr:hypothetical protein [Kribbella albertanoniae]TDC17396.1 hypothetical protein E1261_37200 [Kribbella albertanoniae]
MSAGRKIKSRVGGKLCTDGDQPHPVLLPLTMTQVDRLVHLAEEATAARGFPMRYDGSGALLPVGPDGVPVDDGMVAGLANLARAVGGLPRQRWREAVAVHFDQMAPGGRPPAIPEDLDNELYLRLVDASTINPEWAGRVPEFVPGLRTAPATYAGRSVAMHFDLDSLGIPWTDISRIGLANLRRLQDTVEYVDVQGAQVAMLSGSMFTASRALVFDTVLRESLHVENPPFGCVVAMPARDLLLVHVMRDPTVVHAMLGMTRMANRGYAESPGAVSPHLYYTTDNEWHQLTDYSTGRADLRRVPRFSAAMHRIEAESQAGWPYPV